MIDAVGAMFTSLPDRTCRRRAGTSHLASISVPCQDRCRRDNKREGQWLVPALLRVTHPTRPSPPTHVISSDGTRLNSEFQSLSREPASYHPHVFERAYDAGIETYLREAVLGQFTAEPLAE